MTAEIKTLTYEISLETVRGTWEPFAPWAAIYTRDDARSTAVSWLQGSLWRQTGKYTGRYRIFLVEKSILEEATALYEDLAPTTR